MIDKRFYICDRDNNIYNPHVITEVKERKDKSVFIEICVGWEMLFCEKHPTSATFMSEKDGPTTLAHIVEVFKEANMTNEQLDEYAEFCMDYPIWGVHH